MASHGDEALGAAAGCGHGRAGRAVGCSAIRRIVAVLHRDDSVMPRRQRCWASWVYTSDGDIPTIPRSRVTYWMNLLQGIDPRYPLFVSLNPSRDIPEHLVFDRC